MENRKCISILLLLICNLGFSQNLDKIFINKTLKKEVEYFIKFSKASIDNEIEYLTINKKEDSIRILKSKKPFIINIYGIYEPYNNKIKELGIFRDELNNKDVDDLIFENGKIYFKDDGEYQRLFEAIQKRDIIELEPDVFLILKDLKGYVNYDYVAKVNKNKIWNKNDLLRKEVQTKADIRNSLHFFINQKTGDLESMEFLVQDRKTFIETRFGASCGNCQPCSN